MMKRFIRCGFVLSATGLILLACLVACEVTEQAEEARPSGFLGNYTQLEKGGGETALLHYIDPEVDFARYDKIIIDPVSLWFNKGSALMGEDRKELSQLVRDLYSAVEERLADDYTLVDGPQEGAMRLRLALTEAEGATEYLNVLMTYTPAIIIDGARKLTVGTHAFVGRAGIEMELLDSVTNRRLAAAVDERHGTRNTKGTFSKWSDVREAFAFWADKMDMRLAQLRGGKKNFDE